MLLHCPLLVARGSEKTSNLNRTNFRIWIRTSVPFKLRLIVSFLTKPIIWIILLSCQSHIHRIQPRILGFYINSCYTELTTYWERKKYAPKIQTCLTRTAAVCWEIMTLPSLCLPLCKSCCSFLPWQPVVGMGRSAPWESTLMRVSHYLHKRWVSGKASCCSSRSSASECPQMTAFAWCSSTSGGKRPRL